MKRRGFLKALTAGAAAAPWFMKNGTSPKPDIVAEEIDINYETGGINPPPKKGTRRGIPGPLMGQSVRGGSGLCGAEESPSIIGYEVFDGRKWVRE